MLSGCGFFSERWEWNQKLTVEVLVDGKLVSGSAVSHVMWQEANALDVYPTDHTGEATIVDLGERGMLFALIGEDTKYVAQYTLHEELGEDRADYERLLPKIEKFRGTSDVPTDHYPLLVTFGDINDPKTVEQVDPSNLEAAFGPGVSLKRITLEITDETVTEGSAERVLGWLKAIWPNHLDGRRYETVEATNRFANSLSAGSFSTEISR